MIRLSVFFDARHQNPPYRRVCASSVTRSHPSRRRRRYKPFVFVAEDITFEHAPSPQNPAINTDALIECRVSGQPVPEVTWRYIGQRISSGTSRLYNILYKINFYSGIYTSDKCIITYTL